MKKKGKKILFILLFVIILCVVAYIFITKYYKKNENGKENNEEKVVEVKNKEELKIVDINSNSRPIAIMINNLNVARGYQSGLQDAYIVYEMIVEGGITRLMAVFKDKDISRVGPVRSSRDYYLDYALENDAIYVHFGWSPQAKKDISSLGVNNLNGLYDEFYWREDLPIAYEHTAFTSMKNINKYANNKGYRSTTNKDLLLKYSSEEVDLSELNNHKSANSIDIKYSYSSTTNYVYNKKEKVYYRSTNDVAQTDYVTKKQLTAKNIIIAYASNEAVNNDSKGRQTLNNIGSGSGYYITDGYAVPINWTKSSRSAQTVYTYKDGEQITVNDGNTYIQIAPINSATIK